MSLVYGAVSTSVCLGLREPPATLAVGIISQFALPLPSPTALADHVPLVSRCSGHCLPFELQAGSSSTSKLSDSASDHPWSATQGRKPRPKERQPPPWRVQAPSKEGVCSWQLQPYQANPDLPPSRSQNIYGEITFPSRNPDEHFCQVLNTGGPQEKVAVFTSYQSYTTPCPHENLSRKLEPKWLEPGDEFLTRRLPVGGSSLVKAPPI